MDEVGRAQEATSFMHSFIHRQLSPDMHLFCQCAGLYAVSGTSTLPSQSFQVTQARRITSCLPKGSWLGGRDNKHSGQRGPQEQSWIQLCVEGY